MRFITSLLALTLSAQLAFAQETPDDLPVLETPRQKIVEEVSEQPKPDILIELRGTSESELESESAIKAETQAEIAPKVLDSKEADLEEIEAESELVAEPDEVVETNESLPLAPFYLSAKDYLELRGVEDHEHLILDYVVTTGALDDRADPRTEDVRLIIGPDYVSMKVPKSQRIFDFKLNRFLEIKPAKIDERDSGPVLYFDNMSLFAKTYRNISTVRQATQNGQRRRIPIAKDQEIDSFWVESSMSWAAVELDGPIKIKSKKSSTLAIWDGISVVSANFEGEKYEDVNFKNALFAFAHHTWPVHPTILVEFYQHDSPPKSLEMVSFGPTQPKGQKQKWELKNRELTTGSLPLPHDVLSAIERRPISPLAFVISEAVENRARDGLTSKGDMKDAFLEAETADDKLSQWLLGQRYRAYYGACEQGEEDHICTALSDLAEENKFAAIGAIDPKTKTLSDFINATELSRSKKSRGAALFALQPYLDDVDTPAFILRTAAMARASMKKKDAEKSGFGAIQAEALLKQALVKDPYDPSTYVGLAQVYAANGAYEQSWDIYDALRAAIPTVDAVSLKIDEAETKLRATSPGYFLPD